MQQIVRLSESHGPVRSSSELAQPAQSAGISLDQ